MINFYRCKTLKKVKKKIALRYKWIERERENEKTERKEFKKGRWGGGKRE